MTPTYRPLAERLARAANTHAETIAIIVLTLGAFAALLYRIALLP